MEGELNRLDNSGVAFPGSRVKLAFFAGVKVGWDFEKNGYLPAGIHKMTAAEFEATFVTAFPFSSTRKPILKGYNQHADELLAVIGQCEQFLDGSFVTNKNDPGDIDMVVMVDAEILDAIDVSKRDAFRALVSGKITRATHMCDAYICPVYKEESPNFETGRANRKYWMGEFGFDRSDLPKGFVSIHLQKSEAAL